MRKIFISWLAICGVLFGVWQASANMLSPIIMFGKPRNTNNLSADGTGAHGIVGPNTCPLTLTTTKTNDLIYVSGVTESSTNTATISDVSGLTWTQRITNFQAGGGNWTFNSWSAVAAGALSADVITLTETNGTISIFDCAALAINGANNSSRFDPNGSLPGENASAAPTISTTHNFTVIYAHLGGNNNAPGSGWTNITNGTVTNSTFEYKIVSTPQSSLTPTSTNTINFGVADALTQ